ncbi:hypothetical protein WA158_004087 [Blastocystis sp. Blastoise]
MSENEDKWYTTSRGEPWVICFAGITFDIDEGQKIEFIYPKRSLSEHEEKCVKFLAMPDCNNTYMGSTEYCFRFRDDEKIPYKSLLSIEHSYTYGFSFFRQQKCQNAQRGVIQKSIVILTKLPFYSLFDQLIHIIGELYFQEGQHILASLYSDICKWPFPVVGERHLLSLAGHTIPLCVPSDIVTAKIIKNYQSQLYQLSSSPSNRPFTPSPVNSLNESLPLSTSPIPSLQLNPISSSSSTTTTTTTQTKHVTHAININITSDTNLNVPLSSPLSPSLNTPISNPLSTSTPISQPTLVTRRSSLLSNSHSLLRTNSIPSFSITRTHSPLISVKNNSESPSSPPPSTNTIYANNNNNNNNNNINNNSNNINNNDNTNINNNNINNNSNNINNNDNTNINNNNNNNNNNNINNNNNNNNKPETFNNSKSILNPLQSPHATQSSSRYLSSLSNPSSSTTSSLYSPHGRTTQLSVQHNTSHISSQQDTSSLCVETSDLSPISTSSYSPQRSMSIPSSYYIESSSISTTLATAHDLSLSPLYSSNLSTIKPTNKQGIPTSSITNRTSNKNYIPTKSQSPPTRIPIPTNLLTSRANNLISPNSPSIRYMIQPDSLSHPNSMSISFSPPSSPPTSPPTSPPLSPSLSFLPASLPPLPESKQNTVTTRAMSPFIRRKDDGVSPLCRMTIYKKQKNNTSSFIRSNAILSRSVESPVGSEYIPSEDETPEVDSFDIKTITVPPQNIYMFFLLNIFYIFYYVDIWLSPTLLSPRGSRPYSPQSSVQKCLDPREGLDKNSNSPEGNIFATNTISYGNSKEDRSIETGLDKNTDDLNEDSHEYISMKEDDLEGNNENSIVNNIQFVGLFQDIPLYSFFYNKYKLYEKLYEISLYNESLIILSSCIDIVSQAVLIVTSLSNSIPYTGDFRPYFTLFDPDYNAIFNSYKQDNETPKADASHGVILGVTNPYILTCFENITNVLYIPSRTTSTFHTIQIPAGKSVLPYINNDENDSYASGVLIYRTKYIYIDENKIEKDHELSIKQIMNSQYNHKEKMYNDQCSFILRKYFKEVTDALLAPIHRCIDTAKSVGFNHFGPYDDPHTLIHILSNKDLLIMIEEYIHNHPHHPFVENWKIIYTKLFYTYNFKLFAINQRDEAIKEYIPLLAYLKLTVSPTQFSDTLSPSEKERVALLYKVKQAIDSEEDSSQTSRYLSVEPAKDRNDRFLNMKRHYNILYNSLSKKMKNILGNTFKLYPNL